MKSAIILSFVIFLFSGISHGSELLDKEAYTHYNEGVRAQMRGDFKNALTNYQRALLIDIDSECRKFILNNTGLMYIEEDKTEEAESVFKGALKIDPNYDVAAFNLSLLYLRAAMAYKNAGDEKMASDYFQKAFDYYSDKTFIMEKERQMVGKVSNTKD